MRVTSEYEQSSMIAMGKGEVDDLSKLDYLDEEALINELCIRYKNGQIYVSRTIFCVQSESFLTCSLINRLILAMC
jgi:myosin heavy subunit